MGQFLHPHVIRIFGVVTVTTPVSDYHHLGDSVC